MPQSFRCPSCAAPLEFAGGASNFQKCEFCGNQIIIPAEVFQAGATNANFGVGSLLNQAHKLKEIKSLALSGQTIPAIKIYRETFGVGLKEAKDAVENIIAGKPVVFTSVQAKTAANFADSSSYVASDRQTQKLSEAERLIMDGNKIGAIKLLRDDFGIGLAEAKNIADRISDGKSVSLSELQHRPSLEKTTKNGSSFGKTLFFLLFIALIVGGIVYYGVNSRNKSSASVTIVTNTTATTSVETKPEIASEVFRFGSEGIGAGQFDDNRTIAVDGEGRIYVANYSGGRVQVFDADGKFLTQWMTNPERANWDLAADRKGNVFVIQSSDIFRYNGMTGELLQTIDTSELSASDLTIALDGSLWIATPNGDLVNLTSEGKEIKRFKKVLQTANLKSSGIERIAIDGAGNIFAIENSGERFIVKFAPDGKFVNRFGGRKPRFTEENPNLKYYDSPNDIAVDGRGRIYVSNTSEVFVYDNEGRFLDTFDTKQAFGMVFTDKNELLISSRPFVIKYEIRR